MKQTGATCYHSGAAVKRGDYIGNVGCEATHRLQLHSTELGLFPQLRHMSHAGTRHMFYVGDSAERKVQQGLSHQKRHA